MTDFEKQDYDQRQLLVALRNGDIPFERSQEYWSDEERQELRRRFHNGEGISKISLLLQRSENAIFQQLAGMGLSTPPDKQRTRALKPPKCKCPHCLEFACPHYNGKDGSCCV